MQGLSDAKGLPVTWSETENVVWKTPVHGKAWSSPVVWGEQVWVSTASPDGRELGAVCVDKNTGKVVYDLKLFHVANPQPLGNALNAYGSPTPVIEEGRVYVTFGSSGTACLDTKTGHRLWERTDLPCNHFRGPGSSLLMYKNLLILPFDGSDYQYVVAMDKKTGDTVWKTNRSVDYRDLDPSGKPQAAGDWRKAFSTPRVATFDGKDILLSLGSKALYAYEPATGVEIWRVDCHPAHSGSATPVAGPDLVYFCTGHGKAELWAVKPGGEGTLGADDIAWKVTKNVPTRSSVLLVDDLLYMIDEGGMASCVEARTGKEVWKERIKGNYSASPLYADGRIYFFSEQGKTAVVQPGRQFKLLAENELGDGFMASAAVSGKALILRSKTHLYRVEKKS
jgi:outer membrane protein assembly factor BamB